MVYGYQYETPQSFKEYSKDCYQPIAYFEMFYFVFAHSPINSYDITPKGASKPLLLCKKFDMTNLKSDYSIA